VIYGKHSDDLIEMSGMLLCILRMVKVV